MSEEIREAINRENNAVAEYMALLKSVNREGIDRLISYINKTDFCTAPASTKYHLA